jgi:hypothetical protein
VYTACRQEFLGRKRRRRRLPHLANSVAPRRSTRVRRGSGTTGWDNQRGTSGVRGGIVSLGRGRRMSTDENTASESDDTRSDDDLHSIGMWTSSSQFLAIEAFLVVVLL